MILLSKSYGGYLAGTIAQFQTATESALVSAGYGTISAGPVTAGAVTTTQTLGRVGIAAAGTAVVVTNSSFTTESKFLAVLSNIAADTTATSVRVTPGAGFVTFTLNAASTGIVAIDWVWLTLSGETPVS